MSNLLQETTASFACRMQLASATSGSHSQVAKEWIEIKCELVYCPKMWAVMFRFKAAQWCKEFAVQLPEMPWMWLIKYINFQLCQFIPFHKNLINACAVTLIAYWREFTSFYLKFYSVLGINLFIPTIL